MVVTENIDMDARLIRVICNEASSKEEKEVLKWINLSEANRVHFEELKNIWTVSALGKEDHGFNEGKSWKRIQDRTGVYLSREKNKTISFNKRILRFAALIALILSVGATALLFVTRTSNMEMLSLNVAPGEQEQLVLPDGSRVWLNGGSILEYPGSFTGGSREVVLQGEAYFEVVHNPKLTFVVSAGDLSIEVIGTKFNVSSYSNDQHVNTTLVEGKILVRGENLLVELEPGKRATYKKQDGSIALTDIDTDKVIGWTKGIISFENERFDVIAKKLERFYDLSINYDPSLAERSFTGTFVRTDSVHHILEVFSLSTPIKYKMIDRLVSIELRDQ